MEKDYFVYVWLDPKKFGNFVFENKILFNYKPFYVGSGRGRRHKVFTRTSNDLLKNKLLQMEELNTKPISIKLFAGLKRIEAEQKEKYMIGIIKRINENGFLLNKTSGGDGHHNLSEIQRTKISKAVTPRVISLETKMKISGSLKNRFFSKEHRKRISESKKGHSNYHTPEGDLKQSISKRGIPHTEEHNNRVRKGVREKLKDPEYHIALSDQAKKGWLTRRENKMSGILSSGTLRKREQKENRLKRVENENSND